jgi:hypothetical protein
MTTADTATRKRKQEFETPKVNTSWSDFVYSSPNSPQQHQQAQQQQHQQQQDFDLVDPIFSASNPQTNDFNMGDNRRHSVTVAEMHFHSFDKQHQYNNESLEQLLNSNNNSLPSSWSSSSSSTEQQQQLQQQPLLHRRAMSLRLDNLHQPPQPQQTQPIDMQHRASISSNSIASPTTPAFFSPSFLDALKQDDDMMLDQHHHQQQHHFDNGNHHFSDDLIHDFMMNQQQQQQQQQTITPSVISTGDDEVNNLTNWLLNQPQQPQQQQHNFYQQKRKSSTSSTSSSMSTHSPPHQQQQQSPSPINYQPQQVHPSIPEEGEGEENDDQQQDYPRNTKQMIDQHISARMIQGTNNASMMKPLIHKYLDTFENERKIMILTSKVAQKSYGTEKRFVANIYHTFLSPKKKKKTNITFTDSYAHLHRLYFLVQVLGGQEMDLPPL